VRRFRSALRRRRSIAATPIVINVPRTTRSVSRFIRPGGFSATAGEAYSGIVREYAGQVPACPVCRSENPEGFRFCGGCGAQLVAPSSPLEERRVITVLFADLVGFTSRLDQLDPEDVRRMMAPYYTELRRELINFGGIVEKFIGDAVMAIFGAPVAHEDDPERAVRAALRIRDVVAEFGESEGHPRLSVRIGINTGEALFAVDIAHYEGERLVADFVNVASRLQEAASVNGIVVGESTYRATARTIDYRALPPVQAKGKPEPVLAWEAVAARSRIGLDPHERGRVPLVGRQQEVQLVREAFARSRRERSVQLVTLIGVPGIGKSRLVYELQAAVEVDPELVFWRRGNCLPYGEEATFAPLVEMVKAQAGILETDQAAAVEAKLREAVREVIEQDDEARWVGSHLRPLAGLATDAELPGTRLDEDFAAWRRLFEALAERNPGVMIFEDLHWADEGLLDFIEHLVEWAADVPLLVLCTARPELYGRRPDWGAGRANARTISIPALSDDETARLLAELLEQAVMPAALQSALLARAGGNPLYAVEFVRMLSERGADGEREELPLPDSIQGIIAARLDALPPEEKLVLQDAAVVGRTFWVGSLEHISSESRETVEERLRSLEQKQFVARQRQPLVAGETEYAFRHLLVREVAYGRIPRHRRTVKHRLAGEWLESLGRPEDQAERIAHHYSVALELARAVGQTGGGLEDRARIALREAGDRALTLKGYAAAVRFYDSALELSHRDDPDWPMLRFRYGQALFSAEERGGEALAEARDALIGLGDTGTAAEAEVMLGRLAFRRGEGEATIAHYRRAIELVEDTAPSRSKAWVLAQVARSLVIAAENESAVEVGRQALDIATELGLEDLQAMATVAIGDARIELGDLDGRADFERGLALLDELNSPDCVIGYTNLADTLMDLGELRRAAEMRALSQRAAERFGDARSILWLRGELCGERYWAGAWDEAVRIADAFIAESESGQRHYQEIFTRVVRGRIRLARGGPATALDDAVRALEFARSARDPQALYPALALAARTQMVAGRGREAAEAADELLERVSRSDQIPVAYLWLLDLAITLHDLGRGAELVEATAGARKPTPWLAGGRAVASGNLETAAAIYEEIGALPDEAQVRLRSAARLVEQGSRAAADAELDRALRFYREVGATTALAAAERLSLEGGALSLDQHA
jgi:class 3 adenylate cyclase/tetratricopeptide (TPR) repeat protein